MLVIFADFFQNVAEISLTSQIFRLNFHGFVSEFREIADNCRKSLSFAPIPRNSRENGAKVHQFLMNKFINSSKFGDEQLFISNLDGWARGLGAADGGGGPAEALRGGA